MTQFTIKLTDEEANIIKQAARLSGLGHSTFVRTCAIKEARQVLNINGIKPTDI